MWKMFRNESDFLKWYITVKVVKESKLKCGKSCIRIFNTQAYCWTPENAYITTTFTVYLFMYATQERLIAWYKPILVMIEWKLEMKMKMCTHLYESKESMVPLSSLHSLLFTYSLSKKLSDHLLISSVDDKS